MTVSNISIRPNGDIFVSTNYFIATKLFSNTFNYLTLKLISDRKDESLSICQIKDEDVAVWLMTQIKVEATLQIDAAIKIAKIFGNKFIYINDNGNLAISKSVLLHFRKISKNSVVWEKEEKLWRLRLETDSSGREQL